MGAERWAVGDAARVPPGRGGRLGLTILRWYRSTFRRGCDYFKPGAALARAGGSGARVVPPSQLAGALPPARASAAPGSSDRAPSRTMPAHAAFLDACVACRCAARVSVRAPRHRATALGVLVSIGIPTQLLRHDHAHARPRTPHATTMPATAGRVKMPANNRMQTSASLNTHSIWQNAIGCGPPLARRRPGAPNVLTRARGHPAADTTRTRPSRAEAARPPRTGTTPTRT